MNKLFALLGLFRKGVAVEDCSKSGDKAAIAGAVFAALVAAVGVAAAFGYTIPMDDQMLQAVAYLAASAIVTGLTGWHVAANPAVGLPAVSVPAPPEAYPWHVPPRPMPVPLDGMRAGIGGAAVGVRAVPPAPSGGNVRGNDAAGNREPETPLFTG